MAIICPNCGAQYDITLFEFGQTVKCDCGHLVDASQPQRNPLIDADYKDKWQVKKCDHPDQAYQVLKDDRIWGGYAICDLESPMWERSSFYFARSGDSTSLVLHVDLGDFHVLTAFGDPHGIHNTWRRIPLPQKAWISLRTSQEMDEFCRYYRVDNLCQMWRLHLPRSAANIPSVSSEVIPVGVDRCEEVELLLKDHPECAFSRDQIGRGVFYGIDDGQRLIALCGTHVMSIEFKIAAVGNAYTHPEHRGRGYYRACLSSVVNRLLDMGVEDIVANVVLDNMPSLSGALSIGFAAYCTYWEGIAYRR